MKAWVDENGETQHSETFFGGDPGLTPTVWSAARRQEQSSHLYIAAIGIRQRDVSEVRMAIDRPPWSPG